MNKTAKYIHIFLCMNLCFNNDILISTAIEYRHTQCHVQYWADYL